MGVIQGSLNQLAGTALGAAGTGMVAKKISADLKEQKERKIENAYDTLAKTGDDIIASNDKFKEIKNKIESGSLADKNDITMAKVALTSLAVQTKAIEMRKERALNVLSKAGLTTGGNK